MAIYKDESSDTVSSAETGNRLQDLAMEYVQLGGKRKAVIDDNLVSTRKWSGDPAAAEAFWRETIETLPEEDRKNVARFLPDINAV